MTQFSKSMPLNDNGRVVVPKEVREAMGVKPGDEIIFQVDGDEVRLTSRAALVKRLRGIFKANDNRDHTAELLEERRQEAARKWS
jgi:AbrB family looped-hinge helix DNA binding protein